MLCSFTGAHRAGARASVMESLWECRDLERFSRTLKSHSSGRNLDFSLLLNHLHSTLCYFPLQSLQNLFYTLPFCTDAAMGSVVVPHSLNTAKQRQIFSSLHWKWCTFRIFFFFLFQQLGLWFVCIYAQNNIYTDEVLIFLCNCLVNSIIKSFLCNIVL